MLYLVPYLLLNNWCSPRAHMFGDPFFTVMQLNPCQNNQHQRRVEYRATEYELSGEKASLHRISTYKERKKICSYNN